MTRRAMAVEELCLWLAAHACDMSIPGQGTVLVAAERLGAYAMLALLNAGAEAVVTGGAMEGDSLSVALARAGGLPLVGEVAGLFAWVREGDILLVDAGAGQLRVNPPASVVARHRHG